MKETEYAYHRRLPEVGYETAVERTTAALSEEQFGVLTSIDVREALKRKLDVDHRRYVILGACNPRLAHQTLAAEDGIGLLLPCNVVVAEADGGSEVAILRPRAMFTLAGNPELEPVVQEADDRLRRVLDRLAKGSA